MNMRIDQLTVQNFKGFKKETFEFDKSFNLLVGVNGSGKTSVLDALAVALGVWHVADEGVYGWRPIQSWEVRIQPMETRGLPNFEPQYPVSVRAKGVINGIPVDWTRDIPNQRRTSNREAGMAVDVIRDLLKDAREASDVVSLPVLAYYGAGRLWQDMREIKRIPKPEVEAKSPPKPNRRKLSRLEAYRHCLDSRIRSATLREWLLRVDWASYQDRSEHPVYASVKEAILGCIPGMNDLFFDPKRMEPVVRSNGKAWPYDFLSDGQRSVMAMVGDLAVKAVTANPHLGADAIKQTSGVVLIDELDLHLHPAWQRRVVGDLKRAFPNIQFFCSTHSPQVIGEVKPNEVRLLDWKSQKPTETHSHEPGKNVVKDDGTPYQSYGMDSNWILNVLMGGNDMSPEIKADIKEVQRLAVKRDFANARRILQSLRERVGNSREIQLAASTIDRFELLGK
jgi:predicted ATP-binding protein involved in virulence